jgi:hypothetical protein
MAAWLKCTFMVGSSPIIAGALAGSAARTVEQAAATSSAADNAASATVFRPMGRSNFRETT